MVTTGLLRQRAFARATSAQWLMRGVLAAGALVWGACAPETTGPVDDPNDPNTTNARCGVDDSNDEATAFDGAFNKTLNDTLCPSYDADFWRFEVTAPNQIIDVKLSLKKLASLRLAAEWSGPGGLCIANSAQTCTDNSECGQSGVCDNTLSVCRPSAAAPCGAGQTCASGTTCRDTTQVLTKVVEQTQGTSANHVLQARLQATKVGTYYLKVTSAVAFADAGTKYDLTVTQKVDPDTHEPNDNVAQATALTSGQAIDGYLSTYGDADWYTVSASSSSEPVVYVELTWPSGEDIKPTWQICNPDCAITAPAAEQVSSSSGPQLMRRNKLVLPKASNVLLKVSDTSGISNPATDTKYTLKVTTATDPIENTARNDTPDNATVVGLGGPPSTFQRKDVIIAENDIDWFKITPPSTKGLLRMTASAGKPDTTGYLLQFIVYKKCTSSCPAGSPTLSDGTRIKPWYNWPFINSRLSNEATGAGSHEMGGNSPNYLETVIPLGTMTEAYYLQVSHIAATPLPIPGYNLPEAACSAGGGAGCYDLKLENLAEPDSGDQGSDPDSNFVPSPLELDGYTDYGQGTWLRHYRSASWTFTGYISYPGDNDFFVIPAGSYPSGINWNVTVSYGASSLDLRVRAERGGGGMSVEIGAQNDDLCPCGSCDQRGYCGHGAVNETNGVASGQCSYTTGTGDIHVWVNDEYFNDYDLDTPYTVTVEVNAGCPSTCTALMCGG
jgi:hypothetical protein